MDVYVPLCLRVCRDAALGRKDEVDGLLEGLNTVEGSLTGLEDKLQESMDITDDLNSKLNKVGGWWREGRVLWTLFQTWVVK